MTRFAPAQGSGYEVWTGKYGVVNVKDFGAVGDGVHDDTVAIQAAISSLENSGGTVFFPLGTYIVSSPINLVDGLSIFGSGMPQTNSNTGSFLQASKAMTAIMQTTNTVSNLEIENLGFNGNSLANDNISIPYHINQKGYFKNIYSLNPINANFYLAQPGGNYVKVENCIFSGGKYGVYLNVTDWVTLENVFCPSNSLIPFYKVGGIGHTWINTHAWITVGTVTDAYKTDNTSGGTLAMYSPSIEIPYTGITIPNGYTFVGSQNGGINNHEEYVAGGSSITTLLNGAFAVSGVYTNWTAAEFAGPDQYSIKYQNSLAWQVLTKVGIERGFISGSTTVYNILSTAGYTIGYIAGGWFKIPATSLPAVGTVATFPITGNMMNNALNQAVLLMPYSGFAVPSQQIGWEIQPTATGINIAVTSFSLPTTPEDLIFTLLFGA